MQIPTDKQIRALHERFAPTPEAFDLVYTHCEIVCAVAEQLLASRRLALDVDLVRAGSLLHDIGVYRQYDPCGELDHANYVRHGVLGYELLQDLGFPASLCRFCSCHIGVGLSTTPPTFVTAASYTAKVRRFGASKAARFAAMVDKFGEPDLGPLMEASGQASV